MHQVEMLYENDWGYNETDKDGRIYIIRVKLDRPRKVNRSAAERERREKKRTARAKSIHPPFYSNIALPAQMQAMSIANMATLEVELAPLVPPVEEDSPLAEGVP